MSEALAFGQQQAEMLATELQSERKRVQQLSDRLRELGIDPADC
jgi:hypothetical protein